MGETLFFDVGGGMEVGIYNAVEDRFTAYASSEIQDAISRIKKASLIVYFCGNNFVDMEKLGREAGQLHGAELEIEGEHINMLPILWEGGFFAKNGDDIFSLLFPEEECPQVKEYQESYAGMSVEHIHDIWVDCFQAFRFWEAWMDGLLEKNEDF